MRISRTIMLLALLLSTLLAGLRLVLMLLLLVLLARLVVLVSHVILQRLLCASPSREWYSTPIVPGTP